MGTICGWTARGSATDGPDIAETGGRPPEERGTGIGEAGATRKSLAGTGGRVTGRAGSTSRKPGVPDGVGRGGGGASWASMLAAPERAIAPGSPGTPEVGAVRVGGAPA